MTGSVLPFPTSRWPLSSAPAWENVAYALPHGRERRARSEDIALAPLAERHVPELNAIPAVVSEVRAEGVGWRVRCAGPVALDVLLPRWSAAPQPGETVAALVRPVAAHVFEAGNGALSPA